MARKNDIAMASIFAGCPTTELDVLRGLATPLRVQAGEDVVHQGDFGNTFGVITDGRASVWIDGDQRVELGPGDCYGEIALLAGAKDRHRSATVRAESELTAQTVTARELNGSLDQIPTIAEALRAEGTRRMDQG